MSTTETLNEYFKITQLNNKLGLKLFNYNATHKITNSLGTGTDTSKELALLKAVHEAAERNIFQTNSKQLQASSSSGFACHFDKKLARESALKEAIERDSFLVNWLTFKTPKWIDTDNENIFDQILLKEFYNNNFQIKCGILSKTGENLSVVAVLLPNESNEFGAVFSCACSGNIKDAFLSTFYELQRAANVIINRRQSGLILKNISEVDIKSTSDHFEYYLNYDNFEKIEWFFKENTSQIKEFPNVDFNFYDFEIDYLPWRPTVSYCSHKHLQSFFVGQTEQRFINSLRISSVYPNVDLGNLNMWIHPLP